MSERDEAEGIQRRILLVVLILNAALFVGLGIGGLLANSSALLANALDNASDSAVYLISFLAVGRALIWKTRAARASGILLLIFAAGVLLDVLRRTLMGTEPIGWTMMGMGGGGRRRESRVPRIDQAPTQRRREHEGRRDLQLQ